MIAKLRKLVYQGVDKLTTKTVDDEYINWLSFANAGMLSRGNVYAMRFAIARLPSKSPVVEIGSFCGLSTNVIRYLLSANGRTNDVISCDKWLFEGAEGGGKLGDSDISHRDYREFVVSTFKKNVEFFSSGNKPYTVEMTSDEFFAAWERGEVARDVFGRDINLGGKISFCYVDGNHTYEFVKRDFGNIDRNLESGGFVLFDDSSDLDPFGLTRLMKEMRRNHDYELVMKNPNYLFRKIA